LNTIPPKENASATMDIKAWLFERLKAEALGFGLEIREELSSYDRPWGGFLRFSETCLPAFYEAYWRGIDVPAPGDAAQLAPKILLVAPRMRLSLQYHHRRSEHWRILDGPVKIALGPGASDLKEIVANAGDVVRIGCTAWHRLEGMDGWARVAEIWQTVDASHPSDENDIVRVRDDFGRTG
jgi:mannose-6-phosphate isomerase-like protein (cupin superfamily)